MRDRETALVLTDGSFIRNPAMFSGSGFYSLRCWLCFPIKRHHWYQQVASSLCEQPRANLQFPGTQQHCETGLSTARLQIVRQVATGTLSWLVFPVMCLSLRR